ncbi:transposase-like protein [Desulfobaculum xiamenense]|uniref:Transposase-like protein n=1 Tax=Desulfobaculum xiamenense TaxID=995050 RepID=A0A846QQ02_9BACT|nr:transposase [Desulfobaculum xiamenense]NJB67294.1 transposase-like protein [Desulfobaculum xiamenense]
MRRKWDARTKARVVLAGLMGGCVTDICRENGIRPGLYYKWRGQFLEKAHTLFEQDQRPQTPAELEAENARLKRLVGQLTLELDRDGGSGR